MSARRTLVATCSAGLCNRLLVLAGSLRLAHRTGREFMLYWPENVHLGCPFTSLFENPFELFGDDRLHWLLQTERHVKLYSAIANCGPCFSEVSDDGDPEAQAVVIKAWYAPKLAGESYDGAFHQELRTQLHTLRPRRELLAEADAFKLPPRCIGVHVRRVDDWEEGVRNFAQSRDDHFIAIMDAVIARVPDVAFFLAADNEAMEKILRTRFGERVLFFRKTSRGRDRRGVEEALIDLLLLSRTAAVLGTNFSSFSSTASLLGPELLFIASEETAVTGLDETARRLTEAVRAQSIPSWP
jgi:hypothetical protein